MDVYWSWTHNIYGLIWQQEKTGGIHIKCEFDGKTGDRKRVGGKKSQARQKRESHVRIVGNSRNAEIGCSCSVPIDSNGFLSGSLKTMKWYQEGR